MFRRKFFCANGKTPCAAQCVECSTIEDKKARNFWISLFLFLGFTLYVIVVVIIAITIVNTYLNAN